eukprot:jgi/Botrbrau1/8219/Bobra.0392s0015.1
MDSNEGLRFQVVHKVDLVGMSESDGLAGRIRGPDHEADKNNYSEPLPGARTGRTNSEDETKRGCLQAMAMFLREQLERITDGDATQHEAFRYIFGRDDLVYMRASVILNGGSPGYVHLGFVGNLLKRDYKIGILHCTTAAVDSAVRAGAVMEFCPSPREKRSKESLHNFDLAVRLAGVTCLVSVPIFEGRADRGPSPAGEGATPWPIGFLTMGWSRAQRLNPQVVALLRDLASATAADFRGSMEDVMDAITTYFLPCLSPVAPPQLTDVPDFTDPTSDLERDDLEPPNDGAACSLLRSSTSSSHTRLSSRDFCEPPESAGLLSCSHDAVTGSCDAVVGSRDGVVGSHDAVAGSCDAVVGSCDAVTGRRDAVSGSCDAVAGSRDAVAGSCDAVAGSHNAVAGKASSFAEFEVTSEIAEAVRRKLEPCDPGSSTLIDKLSAVQAPRPAQSEMFLAFEDANLEERFQLYQAKNHYRGDVAYALWLFCICSMLWLGLKPFPYNANLLGAWFFAGLLLLILSFPSWYLQRREEVLMGMNIILAAGSALLQVRFITSGVVTDEVKNMGAVQVIVLEPLRTALFLVFCKQVRFKRILMIRVLRLTISLAIAYRVTKHVRPYYMALPMVVCGSLCLLITGALLALSYLSERKERQTFLHVERSAFSRSNSAQRPDPL